MVIPKEYGSNVLYGKSTPRRSVLLILLNDSPFAIRRSRTTLARSYIGMTILDN